MGIRLTLLAALALLSPLAGAAVRVIVGPTPIPEGNARAAGDITVVNERLAFALAVESPAPYGVPRGALIDIAPVSAGAISRDRIVFADFIPNNWSAWPNTYQHVDILERGPFRRAFVWCATGERCDIETLYTLAARAPIEGGDQCHHDERGPDGTGGSAVGADAVAEQRLPVRRAGPCRNQRGQRRRGARQARERL